MKKMYRLKRNEEIGKIVSSRKCFKNESFILYYCVNENENNSRICVSVSKKLGNAVMRNKIKRQVREIVHKTVDFSNKIDIVIVVRLNYLQLSFQENLKLFNQTYLKLINKEKKINE